MSFVKAMVAAVLGGTAAFAWGAVSWMFLVMTAALTAGVLARLPEWNWWKFPAEYTLLEIADLLLAWFFAGLIIAAFHKR